MRSFLRLVALLAVLITTPVFGVLHAQDANGTIDTETSAQQDRDIAERLRDILLELGGYSDVTVTVNEGIVTLRGTTTSATEIDALDTLANRVEGVVAVRNDVTETADVAARLNPAVDRFRARLDQIINFLPLALIALAVFLVVLFLGFALARAKQPWDRLAPNAFIAEIYRQIVRLVFVVGGIVIALDIVNATALLSTILGAAGIIGLAFGFAVRDTVENFIASIMLSFRQPFSPNDAIEINGDEGKVVRLTSRATILMSYDGNQIRIPNATVFKSRIVNFTRNDERRFSFDIGVASDADLFAVRELATRTVAELPFTLAAPEPVVWIDRIGDGAIFLTITGWIDQRATSLVSARGEALRLVKDAIEAAGVEVPDTTYRIQMLGQGTATVTESDDPAPKPPSRPPLAGDVGSKQDMALEQIIAAERADTENPDLLDDHSPRE